MERAVLQAKREVQLRLRIFHATIPLRIASVCTHCSTLLKCGFPKKKFFVENRPGKFFAQCRKCGTTRALMASAFDHAPFGVAVFQIFFSRST